MDTAARWDPTALRLIAITDSLRDGVQGLAARAQLAAMGGVTMIQLRLREESPRTLVEVARALMAAVPAIPLIVSSRADVAMAAGAQGVHLGSDDVAPEMLRRIVPPDFVIGASVGDVAEVPRARGADYVAIGPVLGVGGAGTGGTAMGIPRFAELVRQCGLPAVAVGGVSAENAAAIMRSGASGLVVISALFAARDPTQASRALRDAQGAIES
ncbi:thiamine phosphate synthase [soil metagenome]